jgi:hypothetical protein
MQSVVVGMDGSATHEGRNVAYYKVRELQSLPPAPIELRSITVLQRADPAIQRPSSIPQPGAQPLSVYRLTSYRPDDEIGGVRDGANGLQVELPQAFWDQLTRAEVRAGLKPLPEGMRLVRIESAAPPNRIHAGSLADVLLEFITRESLYLPSPDVQRVRLITGAEVFAIHAVQTSLDTSGMPQRWDCSILVTDEEAELIDLARQTPAPILRVTPNHSELGVPESASIDPELIERIQQQAAPVDEPDADA